MSDSTVIAGVSASLEARLDAALSGLAPARLHDLADDGPVDPPVLTIYLYDVLEDASARNRPVRGGALELRLRYLLTPWSAGPADGQRMLGRALRTLHDEPVLEGGAAVALLPLELEERARIWRALQRPYHLSLACEVRGIELA